MLEFSRSLFDGVAPPPEKLIKALHLADIDRAQKVPYMKRGSYAKRRDDTEIKMTEQPLECTM